MHPKSSITSAILPIAVTATPSLAETTTTSESIILVVTSSSLLIATSVATKPSFMAASFVATPFITFITAVTSSSGAGPFAVAIASFGVGQ